MCEECPRVVRRSNEVRGDVLQHFVVKGIWLVVCTALDKHSTNLLHPVVTYQKQINKHAHKSTSSATKIIRKGSEDGGRKEERKGDGKLMGRREGGKKEMKTIFRQEFCCKRYSFPGESRIK